MSLPSRSGSCRRSAGSSTSAISCSTRRRERSSVSSCSGSSSSASSGSSCTRRCAAASRPSSERPVFDLVRERTGFGAGLMTLIAAEVVNLMTCAAEVGGVAICLQLLTDLALPRPDPRCDVGPRPLISWLLPFGWIERIFGYRGLGDARVRSSRRSSCTPTGARSAVASCRGCTPVAASCVYLYFVVGLLGAAMTPYEVYFYSSGAVEDGWGLTGPWPQQADDDDRLRPRRNPVRCADDRGRRSCSCRAASRQSSSARRPSPPSTASGQFGLLLALVGILFAVGGAAIETSFAGAYNLAQFFGWEWGKRERPAGAAALHARMARDLRRSPWQSS